MTNPNAKPKSHWTHPRSSIANSLQCHDIAYATHGALQSMQVLRELDLRPSDTKRTTILDYGCGTGRIARCLTPMFAHVHAFDPVPETVIHGAHEASPLVFRNMSMGHNINKIPEVDYAFSVNVIEHLTPNDALEMIANLTRLVRGPTVLWYAPHHNAKVLAPYLTEEQREDDAAFIAAKLGTVRVRLFQFRNIT